MHTVTMLKEMNNHYKIKINTRNMLYANDF